MKIYTNEEFEKLKEDLKNGQKIYLEILSDSMSPIIKTGEVIEIEHSKCSFKPFDIIVYFSETGVLICHFIIRINQFCNLGTYTTAPYRGRYSDLFPVHEQKILGIVKNKKLNIFQRFKILLLKKW